MMTHPPRQRRSISRTRWPRTRQDNKAIEASTAQQRQDEARPLLLAYLHLPAATPSYTRAVLEGHITRFADGAGYRLGRLFVGEEGESELLTLHDLIDHSQSSGARTILMAGRSTAALTALRHLSGVQILTLDDISRSRH
jgi:hypothetical protein